MADQAAHERARRPTEPKLARLPALRAVVEEKPALSWSPEQPAGWLRRRFPGDADMQVSYEAIYLSLHDPRRRETIDRKLPQKLRTARPMRQPKGSPAGRGSIRDMVSIGQRPAEVEDRAVPGHWEGDRATRSRTNLSGLTGWRGG